MRQRRIVVALDNDNNDTTRVDGDVYLFPRVAAGRSVSGTTLTETGASVRLINARGGGGGGEGGARKKGLDMKKREK